MTGCKEYRILMHRSLDREISREEEALLEKHLSLCAECAGEFKALQSSLAMLTAMPVREPGPGFTSGTIEKAFRAKRGLILRRRITTLGLISVIAVISSVIITNWSPLFLPFVRWVLLRGIEWFSRCSILLTALEKTLSAIGSALWILGSSIYGIMCAGCNPGVIFLSTLFAMIFCFFVAGGRLSALSFHRR